MRSPPVSVRRYCASVPSFASAAVPLVLSRGREDMAQQAARALEVEWFRDREDRNPGALQRLKDPRQLGDAARQTAQGMHEKYVVPALACLVERPLKTLPCVRVRQLAHQLPAGAVTDVLP